MIRPYRAPSAKPSALVILIVLVLGILILGYVAPADAEESATRQGRVVIEEPIYDEYEGLDLVQALIRDGRTGEARGLIQNEETKQPTSTFLLRLKADLAKAEENWTLAASSYRSLLQQVNTRETSFRSQIYENLAEVESRLQNPKACAEAFAKTTLPLAQTSELLRSRCEFQVGMWEASWKSLNRLPDSALKERESLQRYLQMGLRHQAETFVLQKLILSHNVTEHLNFAEILLSQGAKDESFRVLEMSRARFPMSDEVLVAWAQIAHQKGLTLATAEAFSQAAFRNPKYHFHAAELFRQIGRPERSTIHAFQIRDPEQKLKHKIAMAVDQGRFEEIASLAGPISRSKLAQEDEITYALAFSMIKRGDSVQADRLLSQISTPAFLEKVTALRETLAKTR